MTETIPRPRGDEAGDVGGPGPLLVCAPLGIEARAIRRGLAGGIRGARSPPVIRGGLGGIVPPR